MELLTPAKINLFLRVTGRRADGYHELDSLFLPISLFDRIVIEASDAPAAAVSLRCNWKEIPLDDNNLAARAARLFLEANRLPWRITIDLHKEIPAGAGLGGGSSDAGGVLRMMASLKGIDPAALASMALGLGADVPFFLDPRPARVGGVGERITVLDGIFRLYMTVGVPPVAVPTAETYRRLERRQWSGPGLATLPSTLEACGATAALLVNDLEHAAATLYPEIAEIKAVLYDLGAAGAAMSGSGGAVFGLFLSQSAATKAAKAAAEKFPGARFFAVEAIRNSPSINSLWHSC